MMLGIAASSSIIVASGRFSQIGQISVMNTATPNATGMPTSIAIAEVTSVP